MRQIWITKAGPPETLAVREAPDPMPGPGQVRIRVEASGINFADIMEDRRRAESEVCPRPG